MGTKPKSNDDNNSFSDPSKVGFMLGGINCPVDQLDWMLAQDRAVWSSMLENAKLLENAN